MQGQRYPQQQWGGQPGYGQQMGGMQPMGYGQQMGGYNPQMQQQQQQAMLYQQQMQGPYAAQVFASPTQFRLELVASGGRLACTWIEPCTTK